jgi:F-type H+-transporting ATPase subunit epsilon
MAIQCTVVTPERTELECEANFVTLPMYDGELGVGKGRAALIGRLGYGILRLDIEGEIRRFFIDGGFAQVENDSISVLTSRAIPADQLDVETAEQAVQQAAQMPGGNTELMQIRDQALLRARGMLRAARHPK